MVTHEREACGQVTVSASYNVIIMINSDTPSILLVAMSVIVTFHSLTKQVTFKNVQTKHGIFRKKTLQLLLTVNASF